MGMRTLLVLTLLLGVLGGCAPGGMLHAEFTGGVAMYSTDMANIGKELAPHVKTFRLGETAAIAVYNWGRDRYIRFEVWDGTQAVYTESVMIPRRKGGWFTFKAASPGLYTAKAESEGVIQATHSFSVY